MHEKHSFVDRFGHIRRSIVREVCSCTLADIQHLMLRTTEVVPCQLNVVTLQQLNALCCTDIFYVELDLNHWFYIHVRLKPAVHASSATVWGVWNIY